MGHELFAIRGGWAADDETDDDDVEAISREACASIERIKAFITTDVLTADEFMVVRDSELMMDPVNEGEAEPFALTRRRSNADSVLVRAILEGIERGFAAA
ncbi:MAG: hypothetical protein HYV09_35325 [Deltaproteobacteria bacterium]|nr:hypothetical protein [Deltaproteobacteria bacterium]